MIDVGKLQIGFYRLFWKEGGHSDAAVGASPDGWPWYAPINWLGGHREIDRGGVSRSGPWTDWTIVERVERLVTIPLDIYVKNPTRTSWGPIHDKEDPDASLPLVADALAAGRYDEAITIYLETHWNKVTAILDRLKKE